MFVIADDDEDIEEDGGSSISSSDDGVNQLVNISLYTASPDILHSFTCYEVTESGRVLPRFVIISYYILSSSPPFLIPSFSPSSYLLLSGSIMTVLREAADRPGWGRVKHSHQLQSILKITAKKKSPDIITFKYGTMEGETPIITDLLRLRIPNTKKATEAIKLQISKITS